MIWGTAFVLALAAAVIWPNFWILWTTRKCVHGDVDDIPGCETALVLGCAPKLTSGRDNFYFTARLVAAAQLIARGKAKRLLVSGGPLRLHAKVASSNASEVDCMKDALIALGVATDVIDVDPLGLRTRLSVDRVRASSSDPVLIIVSQAFHLPRAAYLARQVGLRPQAFSAKAPTFWSKQHLKVELREVFARALAFWER